MQKLFQYIANYVEVPPRAIDALMPHIYQKDLAKGDFFIRQGEVCRHIAFIEEGFLRLFYEVEGKDITRDITREHTFLAAMSSYLSGRASEENVQALTDCKLWVIQKGKLEGLYDEYPVFERLARKSLEEFFIQHQQRIYTLIAEPAETRYERLLKERPDVLERVPLQYIASLLGIAQPTLSRIRKRIVGK